MLEGEKYEPATNLFQRLACTPIEPRTRRKIERGLEGRDRSRGARPACSHPLFAVLFKKLAARCERCPTPRDSRLFYLRAATISVDSVFFLPTVVIYARRNNQFWVIAVNPNRVLHLVE